MTRLASFYAQLTSRPRSGRMLTGLLVAVLIGTAGCHTTNKYYEPRGDGRYHDHYDHHDHGYARGPDRDRHW